MEAGNTMRERGRALEEEWAQQLVREAVAKVRTTRLEDEERQRLAEVTQISSPELISRMRALGFDAESAALLFLVPLVGMSGADGTVSYAERALVKDMARRGVQPGSRAWATLDGWLLEPPPHEALAEMLALLRDVLAAMPVDQGNEVRSRLRSALDRVGRVSGGFLGVGTLSRAERRFLTACDLADVSGEGN